MKILWHVETCTKECGIIQKARTIDLEHTPAVFAHATLARKLPPNELQKNWKGRPDDKRERRILVIMISRKYIN